MDNILLLVFGICLSTLGIINIKGNIGTIHSCNRRNVKEEDIPDYGKAVGTGTLVIGVSLIISYLVTFWNQAAIDLLFFRQWSSVWRLFYTDSSNTIMVSFNQKETPHGFRTA